MDARELLNADAEEAAAEAAADGRTSTLKKLLKKHGLQHYRGELLKRAIMYGNLDCLRLLLEQGVDTNRLSDQGIHSALIFSVLNAQGPNDVETLRLLATYPTTNLNQTEGPASYSALYFAVTAWRNSEAKVKVLLEAGADPHIRDASGRRPMDYILDNNPICHMLLEHSV